MFQRNAWYVACTSGDIDRQPLGRRICGEPVVFFRGRDGAVAALEDFCPHRGAPLSMGFVRDGELVCYHGLAVNADGQCAGAHGQGSDRPSTLRRYPVVERYGFVWVWPGNPGLASPSGIPAFAWADSPQWTYAGGQYYVRSDYRLIIDHLMDPTRDLCASPGGSGLTVAANVPLKTSVKGFHVIASRHLTNIAPPPFWSNALAARGLEADVLCDYWQLCHFLPPGHILVEAGVAHAGRGGYVVAQEHGASVVVAVFVTPESEASAWQFWGIARNFKPEDASLTARIRESQSRIFGRDVEMLEAQQRNLLICPERKRIVLDIDAGGLQARRIIAQLVGCEQPVVSSVP